MTKEKKWKIATASLFLLVLLVALISGILAIREGDNADRAVTDHDVNPKVITLAEVPVTGSEMSTNGPKAPNINEIEDLESLLTELMMTNDVRFLKKAQLLFPDDLDVVILSALWADSADSEWLAKLETLQPDNALPNLIRASLHADESNLAQFAAEMEKALAKPDLDTHFKERLARKLDGMILYGKLPSGVFDFRTLPDGGALHDGSYGVDSPFARHKGRISVLFYQNNDIYGGEDATSSMGLAWAEKLQSMPGLDFSYRLSGLRLESAILERYTKEDLYGPNGLTVGGRQEEVARSWRPLNHKMSKFNELIVHNHSDFVLKKQFFVRLAADGEMEAVNWLMTQ